MAWFVGETRDFLFFFLGIAKFNESPEDVHIQYFFETVSKWIPVFLFKFLFHSYRNSYHDLCLDTK